MDPQTEPTTPQTEPTNPPAEPPEPPAEPTEPTTPPAGSTVNAHKYQRDIEARDKRIAALEAQLKNAGDNDDKVKQLEEKLDGFLNDQATAKTNAMLTDAGCIDTKAAAARLEEFEGDAEKLKTACPYLFKTVGTQSTGGNPTGTPDAEGERLKKYRRLMGLKDKKE